MASLIIDNAIKSDPTIANCCQNHLHKVFTCCNKILYLKLEEPIRFPSLIRINLSPSIRPSIPHIHSIRLPALPPVCLSAHSLSGCLCLPILCLVVLRPSICNGNGPLCLWSCCINVCVELESHAHDVELNIFVSTAVVDSLFL